MKIGLALGSGSARGFSHIGIIETLLEHDIKPDVVAGTSIGAIVGAAYASGNLHRIKKEALAINRLNWTAFFNPSFSIDGWINLKHMQMFLLKSGIMRKKNIEDMQIPFGTVTCDLSTGKEKWITHGPVFDSVWPSMAMPGVFPPVPSEDHHSWYIDGGIVNPVPVSLCRALGADVVIAVNLNNDLLRGEEHSLSPHKKEGEFSKLVNKAKSLLPIKKAETPPPHNGAPDFFETVARSINIAQDRITRSRLAGDPPEVILAPKVSDIGMLETYKAEEAIEAGRKCCKANLDFILDTIGRR